MPAAASSGGAALRRRRLQAAAAAAAVLLLLLLPPPAAAAAAAASAGGAEEGVPTSAKQSVLVVGSVNIDLTLPVHRLPGKGETTTARSPSAGVTVGGKGANQAVAAARLAGGRRAVRFVCRFGNDSYAGLLEGELSASGVDVGGCRRVPHLPSGHGVVMLEPDGAASSVVLGGANTAWEEGEPVAHLLRGAGVVLLQREVPEHVNVAVAAAAVEAGVPVILDIGGEDREMPLELLRSASFVAPNESELQRLTGAGTATDDEVVAAAQGLIERGARNVLVTLAERGSLLLGANGSQLRQEALPVPGGEVVDGTAAGDAFRAGFATALVEGRPLQQCLQLAAAAGALAVSRMGAVPSLPTRDEAEQLLASLGLSAGGPAHPPRGSGRDGDRTCGPAEAEGPAAGGAGAGAAGDDCPYLFASRLNSMRARRDLALPADGGDSTLGWVARQGRVRGLSLVDLNFPQHLEGHSTRQLLDALAKAGLQVGAVCVRFPPSMRLGAFSHPDPEAVANATTLALEGCRWAAELGALQLVVWSPYDGYDYHLAMDYAAAWASTVSAFRQLADGCPPGVRVSIEPKPTDPARRFSLVPNTATALLLAREVGRPNFGLTLDLGHMLLAGENPAQSIALAAAAGRLFGIQLNDAHARLGAEDGLAFGAAGPLTALEAVWALRGAGYGGHVYFDTFPLNEDPVREAEFNVRRFRALWALAGKLREAGLAELAARQDAMAVLELLERHGALL